MIGKRPQNKNLKPFQKGMSGNPGGRPKLSVELRAIKVFSTEEIERLIAKYMRLTKGKLQKILKDKSDDLPMIEALICSILANAYKTGDYAKVEFLFNRTIGKVKDKVEVSKDINTHLKEDLRQKTTEELLEIVEKA